MDVAAFERVYESFREFHAFFTVAFGRKQWREHSKNYLQALLVQSGSVATPRISPRPFRLRPGPCSVFSPRPAGTMTRS